MTLSVPILLLFYKYGDKGLLLLDTSLSTHVIFSANLNATIIISLAYFNGTFHALKVIYSFCLKELNNSFARFIS